MPELPEVETVVRGLRDLLVGQTVRDVEIHWERTIARPDPAQFRAEMVGQRILSVSRRGKYAVLQLDRGRLLVHLRMTGRLLVEPADGSAAPPHLRVALLLDGRRLLFIDARKFGRMYLVSDEDAQLRDLGPEPLSEGFTPEALAARLCGRRAAVKSLLLDQRILAGVGNIYADEALHAACIAPQRSACTLSQADIAALCAAIRGELRRGIHHRGTTFSDYRDANGHPGEHRDFLRAYGRAGQPCFRCGSLIVRSHIGGRSSYHCPDCQK